jgi:hypothetical protein
MRAHDGPACRCQREGASSMFFRLWFVAKPTTHPAHRGGAPRPWFGSPRHSGRWVLVWRSDASGRMATEALGLATYGLRSHRPRKVDAVGCPTPLAAPSSRSNE